MFHDLKYALKKHELWLFMAWIDIVLRYKRTVIGPFWMVISTFVSIICSALIGSVLFRVKLGTFFPYVACGMVIWSYIAILINESCTVFVTQLGLIKNVNIPIISFCLRSFVRNTIVFFHSLAIVFLVLLFFKIPLNFSLLFLVPGIILYGLNAIAISVILGLLATRLRDVTPAINSFLGILAFVTPVMWQVSMLKDKAWIATLNPMYHYVSLLREPLLGNMPSTQTIYVVLGATLINLLLAKMVYDKYHHRLVFWL